MLWYVMCLFGGLHCRTLCSYSSWTPSRTHFSSRLKVASTCPAGCKSACALPCTAGCEDVVLSASHYTHTRTHTHARTHTHTHVLKERLLASTSSTHGISFAGTTNVNRLLLLIVFCSVFDVLLA